MLQGMQGLTAEILKGCWYLALDGAELKIGKMIGKTIASNPVLFCRRTDGSVFALRDACPHRGIPLRHGVFDGRQVMCCYHGWKFNESGTCTDLPSLHIDQEVDIAKINCGSFQVVERYGVIWIYIPLIDETGNADDIPALTGFSYGDVPKAAIKLPFDCNMDHAALGLMDPTHAAFVHTSWWFKKDGAKLRPKEKKFAPDGLGWKMVRHEIPPQNIAYKIFGQQVFTEIAYRLPGYRIEHIEGTKHTVVGLTAITPVDESHTEVHQFFWATAGWLTFVRPLVEHLMTVFLDQDRRVVVLQREGLEKGAKTMLIHDADTQGRWWVRLKGEWLDAQAEGRAFKNPLEAKTLRWRS